MDWEREVCVVLSIQFIVVLYLSAIFIGLQMPKRHVYHELASFNSFQERASPSGLAKLCSRTGMSLGTVRLEKQTDRKFLIYVGYAAWRLAPAVVRLPRDSQFTPHTLLSRSLACR